jgi:anti-sigma B factor antagonist
LYEVNPPRQEASSAPQFAQEQVSDEVTLIRVDGPVNANSAPILLAKISSVEAIPSLVIDLSDCSFVDSTTIGVLLRARRRYDVPGRELCLVVSEGAILRALHVMRLDRVFRIFADRSALNNYFGTFALAA